MLAADRRTASPDSTFFFHPWTWGTDQHPGQTYEALHQSPMQLSDDIEWAKSVYVEQTKLTAGDIEELELFKTANIWNANMALEHGFIDEVVERKIPRGIMTWNIA